jgi:hypothetical protein
MDLDLQQTAIADSIALHSVKQNSLSSDVSCPNKTVFRPKSTGK